MLHPPGCSSAVTEWKLPALGELRHWVASAPRPPRPDKATKVALAVEHSKKMKDLAGQATRPGRTRDDLIRKAAIADATGP